MTNDEREQLKGNLREMIAGGDEGIFLDTKYRWVISGIKQPVQFFKSLPSLLTPDAVLYFEGCSVARDVSAFYEAHKALDAVAVTRDTVFPVSEFFHVCFSSEVVARLCEFAASRPTNELFDHVKAYRGKLLLLHFHDAFDNDLILSEHISEAAVSGFSTLLGASFIREPNINKRGEGLRILLNALEHPNKIRIAGESCWKRWWRRLTW